MYVMSLLLKMKAQGEGGCVACFLLVYRGDLVIYKFHVLNVHAFLPKWNCKIGSI